MRVTIELDREHRARLAELAALRGEKGLSSVIAEAIEAYLGDTTANDRLPKRALGLRGTLPKVEAESLRRHMAALRGSPNSVSRI